MSYGGQGVIGVAVSIGDIVFDVDRVQYDGAGIDAVLALADSIVVHLPLHAHDVGIHDLDAFGYDIG